MALQAFTGFETYPTDHCVTGSVKHLYDFHGHPISEEMLLGLGEGISFAYFHIKGTDPFYVLPYFDFPEEHHFGAHTIVVAGHDPDTDDVLVADRDAQLHPVGWDALEAARGSTFKPFPPQHAWLTFDFSLAHPPTADGVRDAIGAARTAMLEPPISNLGVKGIRKAITETRKWPKLLDDQTLRRTCFNVALFIDQRGGTGGGIFRYMYGRFLHEAATIVGDTRLASLGTEVEKIGDAWEHVAATFARAAGAEHPDRLLTDATEPMAGIADREEQVWRKHRAVVR